MSPLHWKVSAAFLGFALFHSITAHEWFKEKLAGLTGRFFVEQFWRGIYCTLSLLMLKFGIYNPLNYARVGEVEFIALPLWLMNLSAITFFLGVFITYWAFLEFDFLEFLGVKQTYYGLRYLLSGREVPEKKIAGTDRLVVQGVYHLVRHPMLAGGFLMAISGPPIFGNYLYSTLFFLYMSIGVFYEERRLVKNLGQEYLDYKQQVGAFFPKPKQFRVWFRKFLEFLESEDPNDALS